MPLTLQDAVDRATMAAKDMPVAMAAPTATEWPSGMAIKPASQGGINPLIDPRAVAAYKAAMAPVDPHETLTTPIMAAPPEPSTMAAGPYDGAGAASPTKMASPLAAQKEHINKNLMADYQKDADPYGSPDNHPGFFGKLLHGLNVATGGTTRRGWEEKGLETRLQDIGKQESEQNLQGAQAGDFGAKQKETEQNTALKPAEDASKEGLENAQTQDFQAQAAERQAAKDNPTLVVGHAHAVNKAISEGRDPATDPLVLQYEKAITSTVPGFNKVEAPKTTDIKGPDGQVHTMGFNPKTNKFDIDEGVSGFKPSVVNVNSGRAEDRAERTEALKAFQPSLDSAERFNVMSDSYEKAIKYHDQQAMLNLLANHLGMTMGLQKGARITRDLYQEAAQSTPWLQKIGAKFDSDGYLSGVTLNPNQMRQMVDLARERYSEDTVKARSTAKYLGIDNDGPERIPGTATINYYIGKANGDAAKAKALAAQDGWNVK